MILYIGSAQCVRNDAMAQSVKDSEIDLERETYPVVSDLQ